MATTALLLRSLALILTFSVAAFADNTKIDTLLLTQFQYEDEVDVMVKMMVGTEEMLEVISSQIFDSREERVNAVASALESHTANEQEEVLSYLATTNFAFKSFWINNQISIKKATLPIVQRLSEFAKVRLIFGEGRSFIDAPKVSNVIQLPPGTSLVDPQWGISMIQADRVWGTAGHTGVGVVVGIIDTGVRGSHQDLRVNYRTPYGWRDPSFTDINATPDDGNGHGTHCLGTILGSNGIGVAPGARWAACKGCRSSFCLNSDLIECGQWMLCPTLPDGSARDCSKAVHLVSNSWAGGQGNSFYNEVVNAWKTAGIIPIFGQGNSGPSCNTALSPADGDVIGVGATDDTDNLAYFSSKGPSVLGPIKPDISAPGVNIYSSYNMADNSYASLSGTSMATPHVAGAVALMLSRKANMTYDEVKQSLFRGVETSSLVRCTSDCGGIPGTTYPNNCYGHGRLNVYNSVTNIQI